MRKIAILLIALVMFVPAAAFADIAISATTSVPTGGAALGGWVLLKENGATYDSASDPWTQAGSEVFPSGTTMEFGELTRFLSDNSEAGCFYSPYFYIVYLFPSSFGGKQYTLTHTAMASNAVTDAMVVTPVYSADDKYDPAATVGQGDLGSGETLGTADVVTHNVMILQSTKSRIVRAEYGIPPYPDTSAGQTRPNDWVAIPTDTATGPVTIGDIQITLTTT